MQRLRKIFRGRSPLIVMALLFVSAAVFMATLPKAEAVIIAGPGVCTYYSSANYKTVVGARGTGCCGEVISWGVTSPYVKCQRLYCLDVICPF